MTEKTTGYILLVIGIIVMIFATIQIILVFTGKANPIDIFQYEKTSSSTSSADLDINTLLMQMQSGTGQSSNLLPSLPFLDPEVINKSLNLLVYYLIMQFLLGLGFKFASLGVQLIRPINVVLKNRKLEQDENIDSKQS